MRIIQIVLIVIITKYGSSQDSITDNGIGRTIFRTYDQCSISDDIIRCLKIQISKLVGRAFRIQNIKLLDGVSIIKKSKNDSHILRSNQDYKINNSDLENLSPKSLDQEFFNRLLKFFDNHQLQLNIPKIMALGKRNSDELFSEERNFEGRKKDKKKNYLGPFIATVLLKAGIMKMAYHSIAIVAGKALIVGKIALIISAIIGLKKLVSSEGHEKTTYEIVKHPHVQQSHTYSSSHGEYEGGHEAGGSTYQRSIDNNEMLMQDKAYRAHVQ